MTTAPGTYVTEVDYTPPRGTRVPTGTAFIVGLAEKGAVDAPILVRSMSEYATKLGSRVTYGLLYDTLEAAFGEGLAEAYVGRVVGPTSVKATINLWDSSGETAPGDVALVATATSPGAWANGLQVDVRAGDEVGEFKIAVMDADDVDLEVSTSLVDRDAAVSWAADNSAYITLTLGASAEDPKTQTQTLASGDDDRANITDDEWEVALNLFEKDLGPGQVYAPGATTSTLHALVATHATQRNRAGYVDGPDTSVVATHTALAAASRGGTTGRNVKYSASWVDIPGTLPSTTRRVPWNAIELGITARNDASGRSPNEPAAGELGKSRIALALSASFTETERGTLNDAGVNVARELQGGIRGYGNRSLADPTSQQVYLPFGGRREVMKIKALVDEAGERRVHGQVDGRGVKLVEWAGDAMAICKAEWEADALYGTTPEEAYRVDTGPSVNTAETLAAGEARMAIAVRTSPAPERVLIEFVQKPITDTV